MEHAQAEDGGRHLALFLRSIHSTTSRGTLLFLVLIDAYLVAKQFGHDPYAGVRSVAGALLPIMLASFVFLFGRELFQRLAEVPPLLSFVAAAAAGFVLMLVLQFFSETSMIPLAPLFLSSCFAVLAFSSGALRDNQAMPYYYGIVSGLLVYIILFDFPLSFSF